MEASLSSEEARSGQTSPCQQPQAPTARHALTCFEKRLAAWDPGYFPPAPTCYTLQKKKT